MNRGFDAPGANSRPSMHHQALRKKQSIPKQYLGAFKAGHRLRTREFIDEELSFELLSKVLNEGSEEARKSLEFITKFNNEYHKNVLSKDDPESFHQTPEQRKDCSDRCNAQNRDIVSRERNFIVPLEAKTAQREGGESQYDYHLNKNRNLSHEDHLIELLDPPSRNKTLNQ